MVCAPVRSIIPSLKLGDYLSVQAHKPCSISHIFDSANSADPDTEPPELDLHCCPPTQSLNSQNNLLVAPTISWPRGYKTFFMLNSIEHEIFPAHKC